MTAPGQEPDEVLTAKPDEAEESGRPPKLDDIGDNHMPEDLREAEREKSENDRQPAETDDAADSSEASGEGDPDDTEAREA